MDNEGLQWRHDVLMAKRSRVLETLRNANAELREIDEELQPIKHELLGEDKVGQPGRVDGPWSYYGRQK